jgi:hypothetical protein
MFLKKTGLNEYTGDILVYLDATVRFDDIPDGRECVGKLSHMKIITNVKGRKTFNQDAPSYIYSERDYAVPVIITNKGADKRNPDCDWSNSASPITELAYSPIQRWWPKSIFKGGVKLNGEPEEIVIIYDENFRIRLSVSYAYTAGMKELFDHYIASTDKEGDVDGAGASEDSGAQDSTDNFQIVPLALPDPINEKPDSNADEPACNAGGSEEAENKPKPNSWKVKLGVAVGVAALLSAGIYFCTRFISAKSCSE